MNGNNNNNINGNSSHDMSIKLLSINEVCEQLGIGHASVYQLINQKQLKTVKIGARRLVSPKALQEFITSLEED